MYTGPQTCKIKPEIESTGSHTHTYRGRDSLRTLYYYYYMYGNIKDSVHLSHSYFFR